MDCIASMLASQCRFGALRLKICCTQCLLLSLARAGGIAYMPFSDVQCYTVIYYLQHSYDSAIYNDVLKSLAKRGAVFSNFGNLYHYWYPNY